jgi:Signal transduction histidine kinase
MLNYNEVKIRKKPSGDKSSMSIIFVILLWTTAAIFLITDRKNESYRWLSATAFFTGLGGVDDMIIEIVIPLLHGHHLLNTTVSHFLIWLAAVISSFSILLFPYCILMYSISYAEVINLRKTKWKIILASLLLIPVLLMYRFIDIYKFTHLDFDQAGTQIVTYWAAPYILIANFFLIYAYFRDHDQRTKRERLLTCLIVTPTTIASLILGYVIVALGVLNAWKYQIWTVIIFFIAFIICAITYEAIGVRIKFEKNRLGNTMKAISSGTLLINHAIKNELAKISICTDNIKASKSQLEKEPFQRSVDENLQIIVNSVNHLSALVGRIHSQTQEIVLTESPQNINGVIDEALNSMSQFLHEKNIQVIQKSSCDPVIFCDPVHLREVLINICKNAIEAMKPGGLLQVKTYLEKKGVALAIQDDGAGIAQENLPKVIEPFFSTKNLRGNFGLGLSYCYNVMQQHGGSMKIDSQVNIGTTVFLYFNPKKILRETSLNDGVDVSYAKNQYSDSRG